MATHIEILRLLAGGELQSGEAMASRLGLSRTAIWKALDKLRSELGIEVLAVRGQGYRLAAPIELLDAERIRAALPAPAAALVNEVEVHTSIASTNSRLLELARAGAASGRVCLAEHQSHGRGRHGRSWTSPFGRGLLLSILWRFNCGPAGLAGLSLAAGAAVAVALRDIGLPEIGLKWPNDLLWQDRKLAGLLVEVAGEANGPSYVVVGLGLNLRLSDRQAQGIDQPWVDLATALGDTGHGRNGLAATFIAALAAALDRFAGDGLAPFVPLWEGFDRHAGLPVTLVFGNDSIMGIHMGITAAGALRVLTADGERAFHAGEVMLRPVPTSSD